MRLLTEATQMPDPDEFVVLAVPKTGYRRGVWTEMARYATRAEAMRYAREVQDPGVYSLVGIMPHASEAGPFQTHELRVVWEG